MRAVFILFLTSLLAAQTPYDLVLKNGHVIDAKNNIDAIRDVAIKDHKIAAVAPGIPASQAARVIDVKGLYVTPGLVDMHVHVYAGTGARASYAGDLSLYPDGYTLRNGVTTAVDAGSSGWRNFPDFKDRVISRSKTRILAFLNIVGNGMGGGAIEQNTNDMDAAATAGRAKENAGVIVGIKTAHFAGPEWIPVERAVEAGTMAQIPVMVDFGIFRPERPYQDLVLKKLRPGDISTHMYLDAVPMLDDNQKTAALSAGSPQTRRHLRRWPWRRQSALPPGCACASTGLDSRLHFDRSACGQHERGDERHAQRDVEVS